MLHLPPIAYSFQLIKICVQPKGHLADTKSGFTVYCPDNQPTVYKLQNNNALVYSIYSSLFNLNLQ